MTDTSAPLAPEVTPEEFDEIDAILDDLRTRFDETPQWEFCDGFLAAVLCCREHLDEDEVLEVLLGIGEGEGSEGSFADAAQRARFLEIWAKRRDQVAQALDAAVDRLDDERAYQPDVVDVRGAVARMTDEERAALPQGEPLPSYAQVWALGFMFAVEAWPEAWELPRDKEVASVMDAALESIVALTEEDTGKMEVAPYSDEDPPSMSQQRVDDFASAIWGVYDLRQIGRSLGPRVAPLRKEAGPGRNDPCSCGSGKKYKKCCGQN
ncbi:UPF0149 family protein [Curvibacter sp. APW13]|uniref:UPF0149 family protein n=1 Tax=Curvibacter sp. APW13 TaxID=3077236 RepID=UPI0028E01158|nr:UPF0149 family protein [Curvibacter sp. APW13]MDT8990842.1 UPF0149 family protein [Curvibacter sp. APW13]